MAKFDLYSAKSYFAQDPTKFERVPVVQIKEDENAPNAFALLTSKGARQGVHGEIVVKDWQSCGLTKPSVIRITQRLNNPVHSKKYIGKLNEETIAEVVKALRVKHRIQKHKTEELDDDFSIQAILNEVIHD